MEVNKIVNGVLTLKKLNEQDLNIKTTLKIVRNSEEFDKVLKIFNDKRLAIVKHYDLENVKPEDQANLESQISDLLAEKMDITVLKLTIDELADVKLSAAELTSILWLIEGEE